MSFRTAVRAVVKVRKREGLLASMRICQDQIDEVVQDPVGRAGLTGLLGFAGCWPKMYESKSISGAPDSIAMVADIPALKWWTKILSLPSSSRRFPGDKRYPSVTSLRY